MLLFMKNIITTSFLFIALHFSSFSQNNLCNGSDPFCTGMTYNFPAGVNQPAAQSGPNYGCLGSEPNPVWFYLLIDQPGNFQINIHSVPQHDLDFVCWGPFTSQTTPCVAQLTATGITPSHNDSLASPNYPAGNMIDCGYNSSSQEWCYIPNTQSGQYYILMITNYSNTICNIILTQSNLSLPGTGSTNCNPCKCGYFNDISYNINPCIPETNYYSIYGNIIFDNQVGVIPNAYITITDQLSEITQTFNQPLVSPINYMLDSIPSDGLIHTLNASFINSPYSDDIYTVTYAAPASCNTTSINDISSKEYFSIFPNPITNRSFKIKYTS